MRHYSINKIFEMKHISDFLYSDGQFRPERMITDLGLYEAIVIDVANISVTYITGADVPLKGKASKTIKSVMVSDDVKTLHRFLELKNSIPLPCPECRKEYAYIPKKFISYADLISAMNPNKNDIVYLMEEGVKIKRPKVDYGPLYASYIFQLDTMEYLQGDPDTMNYDYCKKSCVEGIISNARRIHRDFSCSLNPDHEIFIECIIHRAIDVCKIQPEVKSILEQQKINPSVDIPEKFREQIDKYEQIKDLLILEKVGQEPSMADLQMFDIDKYKNILPRESFRDFSMALGLYASGVGCGSLLYLRRILERIVRDYQEECKNYPNWNDLDYKNLRFEEKMKYLEQFGKKIIPDDLSDIRTIIYGKLSQGVHELSEQDSLELFPYLKIVIEMILDKKIAERERNEKLKSIKKVLMK